MNKRGLKIIVVGAGKVGDTLVNRLAEEGHDLVIIDKNVNRLTELANLCDCMGIIGNGASHGVLEEAGVASADLFISVTESDELNLLCCTIAKQFNKNLATIARVRNPDYGKEIPYLRSKLSLEMIINPEYEAAVEAARILYLPAALSINSFAHGSAEIVKIKIPEGNVLDGKTVAYLGSNITNNILIVGVERGDEVTIPNGAFELSAGDIISFVATRKECYSFLKSIGFKTNSVRSTIMIGGGKSAFYLADQLIKTGIDVKIIEKDSKRCDELSELLPKATIINGDGINEALLEETGIRDVDSVVAMTGIDEENIKTVRKAMHAGAYGSYNYNSTIGNAFNRDQYPIDMACKTGTAETGFEDSRKEYSNGLFICYAPYDNPEVALALVVEKGKWGSSSVVIAKKIMAAYFNEPIDKTKTNNISNPILGDYLPSINARTNRR